jgi:WD40 domain-containing protein
LDIETATPAAATGGAVRSARALFWACSLYVALLVVLFAGDTGAPRWLAATLLAGLVVVLLHRGRLLRRNPRVYLSYRRSDSAAEAAGVVAALRRRYGRRAVVVGPPPVRWGASLRDEVRHAIWGCDVVCVVIGTDWTTSTNSTGRRRLMLVRDPVRVEVETALRAGIATVPVLVDGAAAPDPDDLPETMRELAQRVPVAVPAGPDPARHADLLARLDLLDSPAVRPERPRWGHRVALLGVAVVLLAPFGARLALNSVEGVGYLDEPTVAPDGVHVAAIVRGGLWAPPALRIWNSLTGGTEAEYRYGKEEPPAAALAWSPDSHSVAVGADDGSLTLRAADTLTAMRSLAGYRGSFRATGMGWSPDGTRLAAVDGTGTLQVWRAGDGTLVGATPVFATYTGRVAWSPRSDAVAVRCDDASELAVVEVAAAGAGPVRRLAGPGPVSSVAWAPDGTVLAAGFAASPHLVLFRRAGDGFTPQTVDRQDSHTGAVAWSPDGTAVATTSSAPSGDGVVRVFDGRTGAPIARFPGDTALQQNPMWAPGSDSVAVADGSGIVTWPVHGAAPGGWESPQQPYGSPILAWTADGRVIAAGGRDHAVRVWRAGRAEPVAEWAVAAWTMLLHRDAPPER